MATLERAVARHALFWCGVGNAVGMLLAALLAFPRLGSLLGPFGYGRWMALHLDLALYGWLALPVVGLLLRAFALDRDARWARAGRGALVLWSAALVAGAGSWLAGRSSGKLFLDWTGGAAAVFFGAMTALFALLVGAAVRAGTTRPAPSTAVRLATLLVLAFVPAALHAATGDSYPPINPASGGPTGTSLLASTLGLALVLLALPRLAALERRSGTVRDAAVFVGLLAHLALFARLSFVDRANDEPVEVLALASALVWAVVLPIDLRRFRWPAATRRWSRAAIAWGLALAVAGFLQFLPEPLSAGKFTHLLVAHAHLAMAGFASSVAFLLLELGSPAGAALGRPPVFALWQGGVAAHVVALVGVGLAEASDPAAFLRGSAAISLLLALRFVAGAAQLAAAALAYRRSFEPA